MDDPVAILAAVLEDHGITQADFAIEAGVAPATVNRWIKGRSKLTSRRLSQALEDAGVDPEAYGLRPVGLPSRRTSSVAERGDPAWVARLDRKLDTIIDLLEHRR